MPKRRSAPYPFTLEALTPLDPEVRPMFSGFAVYLGDKIVLMLRDSAKQPEDNGVWLVFSETANLADPGIRRDFPSLRLIVSGDNLASGTAPLYLLLNRNHCTSVCLLRLIPRPFVQIGFQFK